MQNDELKLYKDRLFVSELIKDVLTDKISVRQALEKLPKNHSDINIKCAFDALVHREADEDLRIKVRNYKEVQDEYLYELSRYLKENKELPQNIISRYVYYHKDNLIYENDTFFKSVLKCLKRIINF